uniref:Uncharacterized protein n=1 Tax=Arundo donax TaxID=35708 RepID=A0A0A9A4D5_ARUDO
MLFLSVSSLVRSLVISDVKTSINCNNFTVIFLHLHLCFLFLSPCISLGDDPLPHLLTHILLPSAVSFVDDSTLKDWAIRDFFYVYIMLPR